MGELVIDDLIGGVHHFSGEPLTLGRVGNVIVGSDDLYLHRRLLGLWSERSTWYVKNLGRKITVYLENLEPGSVARTTLGSGAVTALYPGKSAVVFRTPLREYEIHVEVSLVGIPAMFSQPVTHHCSTEGFFVPNAEQLALLNALSRPLRESPGATAADVPTINQVSVELGWSVKKTNTKLDYLYKKLRRTGTVDFRPCSGVTLSRRIELAFFAFEHGCFLSDAPRNDSG